MKDKELTSVEAVVVGFIVFAIVYVATYFLPPLIVISFLIGTSLPLSIIGALAGRYLSKSHAGVWVGAILGVILAFGLFILVAAASPGD
jgi:hypothetical protein